MGDPVGRGDLADAETRPDISPRPSGGAAGGFTRVLGRAPKRSGSGYVLSGLTTDGETLVFGETGGDLLTGDDVPAPFVDSGAGGTSRGDHGVEGEQLLVECFQR